MSTGARRREEKAQRRTAIIDAAEAVFERDGPAQATIRAIAEEARLSRGLLYVYFDDQDDLMLAVTARGFTALHARLTEAVARYDRGLTQLRALGDAYVAFAHAHPLYFDLLARFEVRDVAPSQAEGYEAHCAVAAHEVLQLMAEVIERGMDDGSIRDDLGAPLATAISLWGFTHGLIQVLHKRATMIESAYRLDRGYVFTHAFDLLDRALHADPAR
jgi:AcrR family transcriptional regulator